MGVAYQIGKQAVPVIANECIVRCFYLIRRLFLEVKQKKICSLAELKTLDAKNFLPFNNRTITHMITVSSGVFFAVTTSVAAVKAVVKNKGEKGNPASSMANKDMMAMVGSFTILRISSMVSMLGIEFTKEELLSLNRRLNKVKLKKN